MTLTTSGSPSRSERARHREAIPRATQVAFDRCPWWRGSVMRHAFEQFRDTLQTRGIIPPENVIVGMMQCPDVDGKQVIGEAL